MTMPASSALRKYLSSYCKHGEPDDHLHVFASCPIEPKRVLYPGCYRHLTASLVYREVVYLDCDGRVSDVFGDSACREYIRQNKQYRDDPIYEFIMGDYNNINYNAQHADRSGDDGNVLEDGTFDLLISLSSGQIAEPCRKYLKPRGILLVNDSHSDARASFVSPHYELIGVYDDESRRWVFDHDELKDHFVQVRNDEPITSDQVEESIRIGTRAKRSFRLKKESMFYLFEKNDEERKPKIPCEISSLPKASQQ